VSRREAWATAIGIFILAAVVRAAAASFVPFAVPEDTAYYWGVARNLLEGRGLVSDALWSYSLPPLVLPRPAFEIWMPLPTLLALPAMAALGTGFGSAQVASVGVSSLIPVLAWRLAADLAVERAMPTARARALAIGSGVLASVYGSLVLFGTLPDSTAPFTVAVLAACILMERVARRPGTIRVLDARLVGIGVALGAAALSRNEAIWYAAAWVLVAWGVARGAGGGSRLGTVLRLVAMPAVLAIAVFAPWAARQWAVFGSPLPGQAVTNALSRTPFDIFAWQDPPSLSAWLAQGPAKLVADRIEALRHNLLTVLIVPAIPVGPIGLAGLPWIVGSAVLRPLLIGGTLTFLATTLLFPVATTWGTFLHAAGPIHVLLVVSATAGLDAVVARVGRARGWRPSSAVIAPACLVGVALPFLVITVAGIGTVARDTEARYRQLAAQLDATGLPLADAGPVIADHPVWIAETARVPALALPDESPSSVLDLARTFGATLVVLDASPAHGGWPAVLGSDDPAARCFVPVPEATVPGMAADAAETLVYRIACP
jgi:hypothetical protein